MESDISLKVEYGCPCGDVHRIKTAITENEEDVERDKFKARHAKCAEAIEAQKRSRGVRGDE